VVFCISEKVPDSVGFGLGIRNIPSLFLHSAFISVTQKLSQAFNFLQKPKTETSISYDHKVEKLCLDVDF